MNRCITCGKSVNRNKAHMSIELNGTVYLTCCPTCQSEFEKNPQRYISLSESKRARH